MKIAQVVPLRRLPTDHSWFDYTVPVDQPISRGQLVEISFGRQRLPGVVWSLLEESEFSGLKPLGRLLRTEPVVTPWQQEALNLLSQWYFVSLGHLVHSAIPNYPKKADPPPPALPALPFRQFQPSSERIWWYRHRARTIDHMLEWLLKDDVTRVICTPTSFDLQEIIRHLGPDAKTVGQVDSQMTEREYRLLYEGVREGRIKKVIGTGRTFLLPFPSPPRWLLDQEEHPAHRQADQHPRFDNRQTLEILAKQPIITTPAPSLYTYTLLHPQPPAFGGQRLLTPLSQPGSHDWLTPESEQFVTSALQHGGSVLAIVPHHGFAQSVTCNNCGWSISCPSCHRRVRLQKKSHGTATCLACGHHVPIPAACPRCHDVRWKYIGLGADRFLDIIKQHLPNVPATSVEHAYVDKPALVVGTYQAYHQLPHLYRPSGVIIASGDALLSYPDYAVTERAWGFLARLQAQVPDQPVLVQTYEPELDFWQRWRHGDDRHWYQHELDQRTQLHLPPAEEHWVARLPNASSSQALTAKVEEIKERNLPGVSVDILSDQAWGTDGGRILIRGDKGVALRTVVPWKELFPTPWQIDPAIRGWFG